MGHPSNGGSLGWSGGHTQWMPSEGSTLHEEGAKSTNLGCIGGARVLPDTPPLSETLFIVLKI